MRQIGQEVCHVCHICEADVSARRAADWEADWFHMLVCVCVCVNMFVCVRVYIQMCLLAICYELYMWVGAGYNGRNVMMFQFPIL